MKVAGRIAVTTAIVAGMLAPAARGEVLYDQYGARAASGTSSQNFRIGVVTQAADDFRVPPGQRWTIQRVEVDGEYVAGGWSGATVILYANRVVAGADALPGKELGYNYNVYPAMKGWAVGDLSLPVKLPSLGAGRYWISVRSEQHAHLGAWMWTNRATVSGNRAAWASSGWRDVYPYYALTTGLPDSPCQGWHTRSIACGLNPSHPDQAFRLLGTRSTVP